MLSRRTVFVVGAGASCELGLPSGDGLKDKIVAALSIEDDGYGGRRFKDASVQTAALEMTSLEGRTRDEVRESLFDAAAIIADALPYALSIDNFLDAQREDSDIVAMGKIGIARAILKAERESKLGPAKTQRKLRLQELDTNIHKPVIDSWHLRLIQLLTAGKPVGEMPAIFDDAAFIVFNYDRCIEHYLAGALQRYYHVDEDAVRATMRGIKIVHPYGKVGALPWQEDQKRVPFGGSASQSLLEVADSLRTFTESVESGVANDVKSTMRDAQTLVFMGFGFLPQNVDLLTVRDSQSNAERVFFTTKGISDSDVSIVEDEISNILGKKEASSISPTISHGRFGGIEYEEDVSWEKFVERGACVDLMNNNWLRLTRR